MLRLIRHGESEANAGAVTSNYGAVALTKLGKSQAEAIANGCTEIPSVIGVSRYLRAQQTAARLVNRFPEVPVCDLEVHEFTYLETERCNGMNSVDRQPMVDEYWSRMDPHYCDGTGSESFSQLLDRVDSFLLWATKQSGNALVFTHEQFIRGVLVRGMYPHEQDLKKTMQI